MGKNFGIPIDVERITYEMNMRGWSYSKLSEKIGWDRSQLSYILRTGRCRAYTLEIIATALGVPVSELILGENAYLKVQLDEGAKMPTRAYETDAGLDLYSMDDAIIPMFGSIRVNTGVHVEIPKNHAGILLPKSGLMDEGITSAGLIDSDYRGSVHAFLFNHTNKPYRIVKGQKVTQMCITPIITPKPVLVDSMEATARGDKGFGSSGKF